jgi:hypothetical protein
MLEYVNPGGAFADTFDDVLMKQAAAKHQALLDSLAVRKQDQQEKYQEEEIQARREEHQARQEQLVKQGVERKAEEVRKRILEVSPHDVVSPDLVKAADESGYGNMFPKPANTMPGQPTPVAAVPLGRPVLGKDPNAQMGISGPADANVRPFVGTPQQRTAEQQKAQLKQYVESLPVGSAERKIAEAKMNGVTLPEAAIKADNPTAAMGETLMRTHPASGKIEQYVEGDWKPFTGSTPPKGAHWVTAPEPKDTSAAQSAKADREANALETVKKDAYTRLDKLEVPFTEAMNNVRKLSTSLNANNPVADSVIAEQVLKATAGGQGSGLRLTQPLITQVLKSRTGWDDLSVTLNKWMPDGPDGKPSGELFLTPEQKTQIRALGKALLQQAHAMDRKILAARQAVDNATSAREINSAVTKLKMLLSDEGVEDETPTPATNGLPAVGSTFNDGKVLKVTPIPAGK